MGGARKKLGEADGGDQRKQENQSIWSSHSGQATNLETFSFVGIKLTFACLTFLVTLHKAGTALSITNSLVENRSLEKKIAS